MQWNKGRVRDPVCGMSLDPANAVARTVQGTVFYFCGKQCVEKFLEQAASTVPKVVNSRIDSGRRISSTTGNPQSQRAKETHPSW